MINIALSFASAIFATRLSPRAVYFIQTGSSALSNTYSHMSINYTTPFANEVSCSFGEEASVWKTCGLYHILN